MDRRDFLTRTALGAAALTLPLDKAQPGPALVFRDDKRRLPPGACGIPGFA